MKRKISKQTKINWLTYGLVIVAFVVMQLAGSFGLLSYSIRGQLVPICVYIVLAVSLNLVVGVSGELSLGHAGFMGVGAFVGAVASTMLQGLIPEPAVRLAVCMLVGGILAGLMGVVIGIPVLRLRGDYLAIVTLAFGEILRNIFHNLYIGVDDAGMHMALGDDAFTLATGGKMILSGPRGTTGIQTIASFPAGFILVLITLFVVLNLINSKEGRAIKACRDNRIAAESVGINATAFKLKAFVVSAFLAGMAGALFGLNYASVSAAKFSFTTSIDILVYVVLGGMGNILGSVISATLLYALPETRVMRSLQDYRMIIYAVVLIVVMLCTWSPKVKGALDVAAQWFKQKVARIFKKKEVGSDE